MAAAPPSEDVLDAFGVAGEPVRLTGGQGGTYRVADVALKRCDDPVEAEWLGGVLECVCERGFRLARPVRCAAGGFVSDGWCAWRWVEGVPDNGGRWDESVAACRAFHEAVRGVEWSPLLERPTHAWRRANAAVWGDSAQLAAVLRDAGEVEDLVRRLRPVTLPRQLIHGDPASGNMLFAPDKPPAIIDVSPYWLPAEYAVAQLLADEVAWSGAPPQVLEGVRDVPQMDQLLIRAVLFRLYVGLLFRGGREDAERRQRAYGPVTSAVRRWQGAPNGP